MTGVKFKPDQTGCQHKYRKGSFFKIYGVPAAKCSTCDRVVAWFNLGTPTEWSWIAEESKFPAEVASNSAPNPISSLIWRRLDQLNNNVRLDRSPRSA
jgi:hypothetical protein